MNEFCLLYNLGLFNFRPRILGFLILVVDFWGLRFFETSSVLVGFELEQGSSALHVFAFNLALKLYFLFDLDLWFNLDLRLSLPEGRS
jgi:hypothetical protein